MKLFGLQTLILLVLSLGTYSVTIAQTDTICISIDDAKKVWHMNERIGELDSLNQELKGVIGDKQVVILQKSDHIRDLSKNIEDLKRVVNTWEKQYEIEVDLKRKEERRKKFYKVGTYAGAGLVSYLLLKPSFP